MTTIHRWTTWWQDDLPCQFSAQRGKENCAYLISVFGESWLMRGLTSPGANNHPLFRRWLTDGAGSFLELNGLAEDLRLLDSVPGIEVVIRDLLDAKRCEPAWHVIHSAALFARSEGISISQFFPQIDEIVPDFLISTREDEVAVEGKMLTRSEEEERFENHASQLCSQLFDTVLSEITIHPSIYVVFKDVQQMPAPAEVLDVISYCKKQFNGKPLNARTLLFNVSLESTSDSTIERKQHRSCYILCPKSAKEDLRVQSRSRHASKQLDSRSEAGLFCLLINRLQDPHYVIELIRGRFAQGQYPGISALLLLLTGTYLEPPKRSVLDLLTLLRNQHANRHLPASVRFNPLGHFGNLIEVIPAGSGIPAYTHAVAEATDTFRSSDLTLPNIRALTPEMSQ